MRYFRYTFLFLLPLLMACRGANSPVHDDGGETLTLRHADLLSITEHDGYTTVSITNPWDSTRTLHRYVLVPRNAELPEHLPEGDVVRTPLENMAVYTSVHCGLIDELGAYSSIRGVCDLQYINLPKVHDDVRSGRIRDLGETMSPNIEGVIDMQPDAILLSPFENSGSYGKVGKLGIPLIECADYMETSPLGRAEWMRFYGRLIGRTAEADSLFSCIEQRYDSIRTRASQTSRRPTVVTEMKIGSTWYVAGGESTVGHFISDAAGDYIYKDVKERGALPYSPETVYEKAREADLWLIKYNQATDVTLRDIASLWAMNTRMRAWQTGNVWVCNLSLTHFYEETPFHPDVLLSEYVSILHPELCAPPTTPSTICKYYKKAGQ